MSDTAYSIAEENRFWLQIIGDNARTMLHAFSPDEKEETNHTRAFITRFDDLLARARQNLTPEQISQLNRDAMQATGDIRKFILKILRSQLVEGFQILILPIYLSHMVSAAELYLYILGALMKNRQPQLDFLYLATFWLPLFAAQAARIANSVGVYMRPFIQQANDFSINFRTQFLRAIEYQGFTRIGVPDYPVLIQFRNDVEGQMLAFAEFIVDLIQVIQARGLPGTLTLLQMDLLYRQVCYFATKLSYFSKKPRPACDPASLRLSNV